MSCGWNLLFIDPVDLEEKSVESSEKVRVPFFFYPFRLAEDYGAFMLRNALAIAVVLGKEDGSAGFLTQRRPYTRPNRLSQCGNAELGKIVEI
jgi:hypothetical protein